MVIVDIVFTALAIFILRVVNYAIGTVRMIAITRNVKFVVAVLAAIEALVFAWVVAGVGSGLDDLINITG